MTEEHTQSSNEEFNMMIMIDSLAERYGLLPSEVINRATTFDISILTAAVAHRNEIYKNGETNKKPSHRLSQKQMIEMLNRVKEQENDQSKQ